MIALALFGLSATVMAQPDERAQKVQAYRVAVFTEVLNLTPDEAAGFWPVYNDYLDKREDLQKQLRATKQIDGMNDNEVEEYVKKYFELRSRELDLEKELAQNLRKVLPVRKIAKLPVAEREFREALVKRLQELRERRQDRQQRIGGRN